MDLKEFLKSQGLSDEQINKILSGMKENKIYTTSLIFCLRFMSILYMKENKIYTTTEENMDIRYPKLKEQKEQLEADLKEANKILKDLKKNNADIEELQTKISEHEAKMKDLEKFRTKKLNFNCLCYTEYGL